MLSEFLLKDQYVMPIDWRSGWERQATGLVTSHAALGTSAKAAVDRSGTLLNRRKALRLVPEAGADLISQSIETGLARELDQALADIARQKRQSSTNAKALGLRPPPAVLADAMKPAEKASERLPTEAGGKALQGRADRLAAENGLLAQKLAERDSALGDARARIKSLEERLSSAAEGAAKLTESQQSELRVARDRVQKKLDTATSENARLSRAATEKDRVLADARTRVEYLEAALAAAEAECGRLTADAAKARDKHQAETSRAVTAEKLLAEARERLLARIIEIDAVRQRVAQANAVTNAAYDRQRQLEDALCLQQTSSRNWNARSRSSPRRPKFCCSGSAIASARLSSPRKRSKRSWSETPGSRLREIVPAVQTNAAAKRHSQVSRMPRTRHFRIGPGWRAFLATLWNARQRPSRRRGERAPLPDPVDLKARRPHSYSWGSSSSTLPPLATHFLK